MKSMIRGGGTSVNRKEVAILIRICDGIDYPSAIEIERPAGGTPDRWRKHRRMGRPGRAAQKAPGSIPVLSAGRTGPTGVLVAVPGQEAVGLPGWLPFALPLPYPAGPLWLSMQPCRRGRRFSPAAHSVAAAVGRWRASVVSGGAAIPVAVVAPVAVPAPGGITSESAADPVAR